MKDILILWNNIKTNWHKYFSVIAIVFFISAQWYQSAITKTENVFLTIPEGFPQMNFPPDNSYSEIRWQLGKKLFYDTILSIDKSLSCASCHKPEYAFSDNVSLTAGVFDRPGKRNAPSLANVGYHPYFLREGSVPTLEMQILVPIQEENEFAHNIVHIAELLLQDSTYVAISIVAYNRPPDPFVITNAIAVFERTLISGNSPFDLFINSGDSSVLTESQLHGMQLFFSDRMQCSNCHTGFNFTNYAFENNGLQTVYTDEGRMRFTHEEDDDALFKVPGLRNVEVTGPYMHDGSLLNLEDVIDHYNSGGFPHPNKNDMIRPLHLSANDKQDLISFLHALTDSAFLNNQNFRE